MSKVVNLSESKTGTPDSTYGECSLAVDSNSITLNIGNSTNWLQFNINRSGAVYCRTNQHVEWIVLK